MGHRQSPPSSSCQQRIVDQRFVQRQPVLDIDSSAQFQLLLWTVHSKPTWLGIIKLHFAQRICTFSAFCETEKVLVGKTHAGSVSCLPR